ncbi:hypothetical protein I8H84_05720 [Candidatus Saccharibacteria bacterium]|nr:hypothetical protein [Candidatus Saccharibacteria bacterium]MBH1973168.1 hypothetical protein [Candidatus Saccharibacteria bacterium]MBH1990591.1 hypothetical protein [Candidatus Saccharibacteria bacterium]
MNPNTISPQSENVDQTTARLERVAEQVAPAVEAKSEEKAPSFWQKIRKNLFKSTAAVAVVGASFSAGHVAGEMKVVEKPEVSQPVNSDNVPMQRELFPEKPPEVYIPPAGPETYELPNSGYITIPPETPPIPEQRGIVQKPIYDNDELRTPLGAGPEVGSPNTEQMFEEPAISKPGDHPMDSVEPREPTVHENSNVRPPESR